ncbi:RNA-binding protein [Bacteriovoracaceae bacterium]|nr:RNA-binding protein [Bacteriovoracaceae bacterium]
MSHKLYVGNIAYTVGEQELTDVFSQHGEVKSVKIITDQETGRSKGFGFVEMGTTDEVASCIENCNGVDVGGRTLRVNEAIEKNNRSSGGGRNFNSRDRY